MKAEQRFPQVYTYILLPIYYALFETFCVKATIKEIFLS